MSLKSWIKSRIIKLYSCISNVIITDYPYYPAARKTFSSSRLAKILLADYSDNHAIYEERAMHIAKYEKFFRDIPCSNAPGCVDPCWQNGWIPPLDGAAIYSILSGRNPRYYVECGSGNTTKFAARAIRDQKLRTKIISIDPHPRDEIDVLCEKIFRTSFEDMDLGFFSELSGDDVFIVDNSHRAFPNSDVTVFFTEVLPELPRGLLYAIHDIAFPFEMFTERLYNEQYMLAVYIIAGMMGDKIYFPSAYLGSCTDVLKKLDAKLRPHPDISFTEGGFFWIEKN